MSLYGSRSSQRNLVERTLLGSADEIKEQTIGSEVLRRAANFDPASDNIVRVRARQLRQKLEQYFQSEGTSGAAMKRCTVSMAGEDGKTQTIEVEATSVFDAAGQAMRCWSMLWWYRSDAVIEVRADDETWKVRAEDSAMEDHKATTEPVW